MWIYDVEYEGAEQGEGVLAASGPVVGVGGAGGGPLCSRADTPVLSEEVLSGPGMMSLMQPAADINPLLCPISYRKLTGAGRMGGNAAA